MTSSVFVAAKADDTIGSPAVNITIFLIFVAVTLAIVIRSLSSLESSLRIGAMALHGPHHSAQKSTTTGWSEPATVSSKVEVERLTIPAMVAASFAFLACSAGEVYGWLNDRAGERIPTDSQ